ALAVDRFGVRLGRGGGHYDRTLPLAGRGAELIAIVRDSELVAALPREPHDIPMTAALTPTAGFTPLPPQPHPRRVARSAGRVARSAGRVARSDPACGAIRPAYCVLWNTIGCLEPAASVRRFAHAPPVDASSVLALSLVECQPPGSGGARSADLRLRLHRV